MIANHDPKAIDRIAVGVLGLLAVVAALTFRDYGLGWDDYTHSQYAELLLSFYTSGFKDQRAFWFINLYYYGGGFDVAAIEARLQDRLFLGNIDSSRDWGHARDYVEMQWLMLQQMQAEDYVIASGQQSSVRKFVNMAAEVLGITLCWHGSGLDEIAVVQRFLQNLPDGKTFHCRP